MEGLGAVLSRPAYCWGMQWGPEVSASPFPLPPAAALGLRTAGGRGDQPWLQRRQRGHVANGGVAGVLTLSLLALSRWVWVCTGGQTAVAWSLVPDAPPILSLILLPFLCRMVEYSLDLQNINLSAIRTVRVLRPLKAINRVPSELPPGPTPCPLLHSEKTDRYVPVLACAGHGDPSVS